MHVTSIAIRNICGIKAAKLDLGEVTVIKGANGTGKTSFMKEVLPVPLAPLMTVTSPRSSFAALMPQIFRIAMEVTCILLSPPELRLVGGRSAVLFSGSLARKTIHLVFR